MTKGQWKIETLCLSLAWVIPSIIGALLLYPAAEEIDNPFIVIKISFASQLIMAGVFFQFKLIKHYWIGRPLFVTKNKGG